MEAVLTVAEDPGTPEVAASCRLSPCQMLPPVAGSEKLVSLIWAVTYRWVESQLSHTLPPRPAGACGLPIPSQLPRSAEGPSCTSDNDHELPSDFCTTGKNVTCPDSGVEFEPPETTLVTVNG